MTPKLLINRSSGFFYNENIYVLFLHKNTKLLKTKIFNINVNFKICHRNMK